MVGRLLPGACRVGSICGEAMPVDAGMGRKQVQTRSFMKKTILMLAVWAVSGAYAMAAADGQAIYMEKCKKCHGENGEGNPKALEKLCKGLELDQLKLDPIAEKSDEEVKKITMEGKDKMPGYAEKLTAEEIDAVVAYCRQLVPAKQ
jgi:mono/diheme cytochrome c family protein